MRKLAMPHIDIKIDIDIDIDISFDICFNIDSDIGFNIDINIANINTDTSTLSFSHSSYSQRCLLRYSLLFVSNQRTWTI